jgi:hypothetical protein
MSYMTDNMSSELTPIHLASVPSYAMSASRHVPENQTYTSRDMTAPSLA